MSHSTNKLSGFLDLARTLPSVNSARVDLMERGTVREAQKAFNHLVHDIDLPENGRFELRTQKAVRAFQAAEGLEATGRLNRETVDRLAMRLRAQPSAPRRVSSAAAESPRRSVAPSPVSFSGAAPQAQSGSVDAIMEKRTAQTLSPSESEVFDLADRANQQVESGGQSVFSRLPTTAGPDGRASFGVGQLTIRAHLDQLSRLDTAELRAIGISPRELETMRSRGTAAESWYRVLRGTARPADLHQTGMPANALEHVRRLVDAGDEHPLVALYGEKFAQQTGLSPSDLVPMSQGLAIYNKELQNDFRAQYEALFGEPFHPTRRNSARMAEAAYCVAARHPQLWPVIQSLGGARGGATALGHYLGVGARAENLHGWYARAAKSAVGEARFVELLTHVDRLTTRMRHLENVRHALLAMSKIEIAAGTDRARVVARIARRFHGAPGRALQFFFVDGNVALPRFHSEKALLAGLNRYNESLGRTHSDRRLVQAFNAIAARRSES